MFTRRTLLCGVAALALLAVAVTAGKPPPPPPPPPPPDPAILFLRNSEIWVENADGTNVTAVITSATQGLYVNDRPAWSGDNTRICFNARTVALGQPLDLYVSDIGGSNVTRIVDNEVVGGGVQPFEFMTHYDWSPAPLPGQPAGDEWIAFYGHISGESTSHIYAIRSDGTGLVHLTNTPGYNDSNPRFSADGTFLVYNRWRDLGPTQVYKATLAADEITGLPVIASEECLTNFSGNPFGRSATSLGIDPEGAYVLVTTSYNGDWIVPLGNPTDAKASAIEYAGGDAPPASWLDPDGIIYGITRTGKEKGSYLVRGDLFTGAETVLFKMSGAQSVHVARRWHASQ